VSIIIIIIPFICAQYEYWHRRESESDNRKKKCNEKEKEEEEKSCILNYRQQIDSKKVLISWPSKIGISLTLE